MKVAYIVDPRCAIISLRLLPRERLGPLNARRLSKVFERAYLHCSRVRPRRTPGGIYIAEAQASPNDDDRHSAHVLLTYGFREDAEGFFGLRETQLAGQVRKIREPLSLKPLHGDESDDEDEAEVRRKWRAAAGAGSGQR
jgi:hypothetical protein